MDLGKGRVCETSIICQNEKKANAEISVFQELGENVATPGCDGN